MWPDAPARLLLKNSGFRLALRSLALSLAGAIVVFAIIHRAAETAWRGQIDDAVGGALSDILGDIQRDRQPVPQNVNATLAEGGGLFFADIDAAGNWRAGNFRLAPALAARWQGLGTFRVRDGLILPRHIQALRGIAQRFPDGETLFIAADASALLALNNVIARSFLSVFGVILALGLVNGFLAARAAQRRVDAFATTLNEIMHGDLARRIAVTPANDEFDRLAVSMNTMLQRLQALMENLRQVTADISHDLRSPLARLREHLERARARYPAPELQEVFAEALTHTDQALEIFAAMLRIAEVEAGSRRTQFAEIAISSMLAMLAESYEPSFSAAGIAIETAIAPGLTLRGDQELLAQLFTNLLDNILLHAEGASMAGVSAASRDGRIIVAITDNGSGIPGNESKRVLQRFVRLDSSRHRPGYGLGLPLALAIGALHEGEVLLEENRPGLRVVVRLGAS
jgi:signal transduction histidine kinase